MSSEIIKYREQINQKEIFLQVNSILNKINRLDKKIRIYQERIEDIEKLRQIIGPGTHKWNALTLKMAKLEAVNTKFFSKRAKLENKLRKYNRIAPPPPKRNAVERQKQNGQSRGAGSPHQGKMASDMDTLTIDPITHPIYPHPDLNTFEAILSTITRMTVPDHMESGSTAQLTVAFHNVSQSVLNGVYMDVSYLENFFTVEGDIRVPVLAPGMQLKDTVKLRPKFPEGVFPVKIKIDCDEGSIERKFTIKVGGTEIY